MAPTGELVITLTAEEVQALKKGLGELTSNTGAPEVRALRAIQKKLQAAEEKML